jgi:25S rRNA (adenine2142-N1)-methyltransferase
MLRLIHAHLRPSTTSLLFLVLPLPCVTNSRYLTPEHLEGLMAKVGFKLVRKRWKEGGKVAYWLWSRSDPKAEASGVYSKKKVITDGPRRNNFAIIL